MYDTNNTTESKHIGFGSKATMAKKDVIKIINFLKSLANRQN